MPALDEAAVPSWDAGRGGPGKERGRRHLTRPGAPDPGAPGRRAHDPAGGSDACGSARAPWRPTWASSTASWRSTRACKRSRAPPRSACSTWAEPRLRPRRGRSPIPEGEPGTRPRAAGYPRHERHDEQTDPPTEPSPAAAGGDSGSCVIDPLPGRARGPGRLIADRVDMEVLAESATPRRRVASLERLRRSRVVVLVGLGLEGEHDAAWLIRTVRERFPSHAVLAHGRERRPGHDQPRAVRGSRRVRGQERRAGGVPRFDPTRGRSARWCSRVRGRARSG